MRTLDENATTAERIRFYRMKRNMKGDTLSELAGFSRHTIMRYENNQSEPSFDDLKKVADALGIEVDKLYDEYYRFLDYPYPQRVKQMRAENNLLQRQLGEMLGVNRRAIERWEHGKHVVNREVWEQLKALELL
jgi:transcriptional regulator with XRE-family HTH domain